MSRREFDEYLDEICQESEMESQIQEAATVFAWVVWAGIFCFTIMYVVGII